VTFQRILENILIYINCIKARNELMATGKFTILYNKQLQECGVYTENHIPYS